MRATTRIVLLLSLTLFFFSGCGKEKPSPYVGDPTQPRVALNPDDPAPPTPQDPSKPDPIRTTRFCKPHDGVFREDTSISQGRTKGFYWGDGGGCILRPIREVWGALLNHALMQWDGVSESSTTALPPDHPGVSLYYSIQYVVRKVFITVDWNMDWYFSIPATCPGLPNCGTARAPHRVLVNYQKVSGTNHIRYWAGTIYLNRLTENVTGFDMRNEVDADRTDESDAYGAVRDVLEKARRGEPNTPELP